MKRRQIHPITPWIVAVLFLVGGGIAFQVWAQQSPEPMQATMATLAARPLIGSMAVPVPPSEEVEPEPVVATSTSAAASPLPEGESAVSNLPPQSLALVDVAAADSASTLPEPPSQSSAPSNGVPPPELQLGEAAVDARLEDRLRLVLGPNTRATPRLISVSQFFHILYIEWSINDHLMPNRIVPGAQNDVAALLQAVEQSGASYQFIHLVGTYPILSKTGGFGEAPVLWLTYATHELPAFRWDQPVDSIAPLIFDAAEQIRFHPSLPR